MPDSQMPDFATRLIAWQQLSGRHDLPWQNTRDPYRIWLSEIMLQQTQVASVIVYYQRFLDRFPDIAALAAASQEQVLTLWSGLGYYSRARNLHRAAQTIVAEHGGIFPQERDAVMRLPGIGPSTAAAICAFSYSQRHAILDGNVKRVLARYFGISGYPGEKKVEQLLWAKAETLLPASKIESYTQGLMDLGATVCISSTPKCGLCPMHDDCVARRDGRTHELPTKKLRKPLPQKSTTMLILLKDGEVMLERRQSSGIWGGLWSLPEVAADQDIADYCASRFGVSKVEKWLPMPQLEHTFTHFNLSITPQPCSVVRANQVASPQVIWLTVADAIGAAIPAPVRKILRRISPLAETLCIST